MCGKLVEQTVDVYDMAMFGYAHVHESDDEYTVFNFSQIPGLARQALVTMASSWTPSSSRPWLRDAPR